MSKCPVFSPHAEKALWESVRRSRNLGREEGYILTGDMDAVEASQFCSGTECQVQLPEAWGALGDFHTHPRQGSLMPSHFDMWGSLLRNHRVLCIGGYIKPEKQEGINCYVADRGSDAYERAQRASADIMRSVTDNYLAKMRLGVPMEEAKARALADHRDDVMGLSDVFIDAYFGNVCHYRRKEKVGRQTRL